MSSLTCYGGVGTVTGANFLLETSNLRILIDCGLLQGLPARDGQNDFDYDPASIDLLFITHAHIDHIGRIPDLVRAGFKGIIYSTAETKAISELMLLDMAKIAGSPLHDVEVVCSLWQTIKYHEKKDLGGISVEIFNSGHILGSAMYKFSLPEGNNILFTGDLGNSPSILLPDTEYVSGLDYLLMDSVYGDRNHESPEERDKKFIEVILRTERENRILLIPIFSLERTQILLYKLNEIFKKKIIPSLPIFLDSPLAIRVTEIYERVKNIYKSSVESEINSGEAIFSFKELKETGQVRDSAEIDGSPNPKVILAGSGMSTAGRILGHEIRFLPDPKATILFVGYQAPGTLGREILEGNKEVIIDGQKVPVRAEVKDIGGFSAHKDSDHLVEFVSHTKDTVKKVFITMGEPASSIFLAQRLHNELGVNAILPERGKRYELI